jgi:poly(beta-D-mannuronate) lyase
MASPTLVSALIYACLLIGMTTRAAAGCPNYQPVLNVQGTTFYADAKGSQVDHAAEQANNDAQAPILDVLTYASEAVDGKPAFSKLKDVTPACADALLENWAKAGAMRTTNDANGGYSRQGGIDRQALLRGFVIVALKLRSSGQALGPDVVPWLGRLVTDNDRNWQKITLRGNLYFWAGATAASYALLAHDPQALAFQNEVWANAMSQIQKDGYLEAELARGARALIYHQYALSALLTLRDARRALHLPDRPADTQKLRLLADRVGQSLCHPEQMAARAHAPQEEMPGEWGFREIAADGGDLMNADWQRCGVPVKNPIDINNGGNQYKTHAMFAALARDS